MKENPARSVAHRLEDNGRTRFLSPEEEVSLRRAIHAMGPEHLAEFDLALNTGLRLSEQYGLRWEDVNLERRVAEVAQSKNGSSRHVRLNQAALRAITALGAAAESSEFVCGGAKEPRRWFEPAVRAAGLRDFSWHWHCLRHTTASRLVMSGADLRTVAELLGHKTLQMVMRYAHLAPDYQLAAVERMEAVFPNATDTTTDTGSMVRLEQEVAHVN